MKKRGNKGFVLLETLVVTVFISSVLIFLFVQFNSLNANYKESNTYNNVKDVYALNSIANYIKDDWVLYEKIKNSNSYINLSECENFTYTDFCKKMLEKTDIEILIALPNKFNKSIITDYDDDFSDFIDKINPVGKEKYRLIAKFKNGDFATIRFGEKNE